MTNLLRKLIDEASQAHDVRLRRIPVSQAGPDAARDERRAREGRLVLRLLDGLREAYRNRDAARALECVLELQRVAERASTLRRQDPERSCRDEDR